MRPGSADEQNDEPKEPPRTRRAWARFVVAKLYQLLNRAGFHGEIRSDGTLRGDTVYYLRHQVSVRDGATLTLEAGTPS